MLPSQYYDTVGARRPGDGVRELIFAVLDDGIRSYLANAAQANSRQRQLFEEAQAWIEQRGDNGVFSFDTLCAAFDIDPEKLRRRVKTVGARRPHPGAPAACATRSGPREGSTSDSRVGDSRNNGGES